MELAKFIPEPLVYNDGRPSAPPEMDESNIGMHHIFDILGRHPLAIILAAKLHASFPQMTLCDLYTTLSNKKQIKDGRGNEEVSPSLAAIVHIILMQLKDVETSTYQFLQLMSLLPTYNEIQDLVEYWTKIQSCSNLSVQSMVSKLCKMKLLTYKNRNS